MRTNIFILTLLCCLGTAAAAADLGTGSNAPLFQLKNVAGKPVNLADNLGSKTTLVAFFTSWSQSCRQELALLQELADQYQDKGLKVVAVSFDRKSEELKKYLAENKLSFSVAYDRKLSLLKEYRILIIPTLFVLDAEGKISNIYVDFDDNIRTALSAELSSQLEPPAKSAE